MTFRFANESNNVGLFRLDESNGQLFALGPFNHTQASQLALNISCTDTGSPSKTTYGTLNVVVVCKAGYALPACTECAEGYGGSTCAPCQRCSANGRCGEGGACICLTENFVGEDCTSCAPRHYGPLCEKRPWILSIAPDSGPDVGGTPVVVTVDHLNQSVGAEPYRCKFGSVEVAATKLDEDRLQCSSPRQPAGAVRMSISLDGGATFTPETAIQFRYRGLCPASECPTTRGSCVFGECNCKPQWTGTACSVPVVPPVLARLESVTVQDGEQLIQPLNLLSGTVPVTYSLELAPPRAYIDSAGRVQWAAAARSLPYSFKIRASNKIGSDTVSFNVIVSFAYTGKVDAVAESPFLRAAPAVLTVTGSAVRVPGGPPLDVTTQPGVKLW